MHAHAPSLPRHYRPAPPRSGAGLLWLSLPVLLAGAALAWAAAHRPGPLDPHLLLPLGVIAALAVTLALLRRRGDICLEAGHLRVRSTLFGKRVALPDLRLEQARLLDLAEAPSLKPAMKKLAFSYPGFWSGYFRSRGGQKLFCLVSDSQRVLALPLADGSWLLLSPEKPRELLHDLKQAADACKRH